MNREQRRSMKVTSRTALLKANDSGPHMAVLPSGSVVKFRIPDAGQLLKSGAIPSTLREAAIIFTSHPDGPDELMRELVVQAALRGPGQDTMANVISAGMQLGNILVAAMFVEPEVTVEDIEEGRVHPLDVRMLREFAERMRNTDAEGNVLPITTMDEWATFRRQSARGGKPDDGNGDGPAVGDAVPDADAGEV